MKTLLFSVLLMTFMASVSFAQGPTLPKRSDLPELPIPPQAPLVNPPSTTIQSDSAPKPAAPVSSPTLNVPPPPVPHIPESVEKIPDQPATSPDEPVAPLNSNTNDLHAPASVVPPQSPANSSSIDQQSTVRSDQAPRRIIYHASPWNVPFNGYGVNPAGAEGVFVGPSWAGRLHVRFPYYSYRRPWYTRGPASLNVDIIW